MDQRLLTSLTHHQPYCLTLFFHKPILVQKLYASGCSTLIYQAYCGQEEIVLRELCPQGLSEQGYLTRQPDGYLSITGDRDLQRQWGWERKRFARAVWLNLRMQRHPSLKRWVIPLEGLFRRNGTLYAPTKLPAGIPLLSLADACAADVFAATVRILEMTEAIHHFGWLLVDIKASNYVFFPLADGRRDLRLTDLDSAVSLKQLAKQRRFLCSSATAPPELMQNRAQEAGPHSDVYSIAATLLSALARQPLQGDLRCLFWNRVAPELSHWQADSVRQLEELLLHALAPEPSHRLPSCQAMRKELEQICQKEDVNIESLFT